MTFRHFLQLQYGLLRRLFNRAVNVPPAAAATVRDFQLLYYEAGDTGGTWMDTRWLGCRVLKCPLDLWVYQEIIHETRPEVIIETGTCDGGSALFLAHVCDALGFGRIVTVDIDARPRRPQHDRVEYWSGSSTDPAIVQRAAALAEGKRVLVILDSDHSRRHVLAELGCYSPMVQLGGYLIVEDTNLNGHPANPEHGPGPMEALDEFLRGTTAFEIDPNCERLFMTFNPRGFLKRVR